MAEEEFVQMMALLESTVKKPKKKVNKNIPPPKITKPVIKVKKKCEPEKNRVIQKFFCEICANFFKSKRCLIEHRNNHFEKKNNIEKNNIEKKKKLGKTKIKNNIEKKKRSGSLIVYRESHAEKKIKCNICGKGFTQKCNLRNHMNTHSDERKLICEFCGQSFRLNSCLRRHRQLHLPEDHQCDICQKKFSHPSRLALHKRMHDERKFQCHVCGKLFTQKPHLQTHMLVHTGEKNFKCDVCEKSFAHKTSLDAHSNTHSGVKPYSCPYCSKTFSQRGGLKIHVETHLGKKHQCHICKKLFTQKGALNVHINVHNGKRFECHECYRQFKYKNTLKSHLKSVHGEKASTEAPSSIKIKVHDNSEKEGKIESSEIFIKDPVAFIDIDTGNEEPSYCCGECGSTFKSIIELGDHVNTHSSDPASPIPFIHKDYISESTQVLDKSKGFECDICGKLFSYKSTLNTHQKVIHCPDKPYKCPECPKEFARKSYLDVHSVVHTGQRKYKCDDCGKSFTQKGSLNIHARLSNLHNEKIMCNECGLVVCKSSDLSKHKKDNHDVRIEIQELKEEQDLFDIDTQEQEIILVEIEPEPVNGLMQYSVQ